MQRLTGSLAALSHFIFRLAERAVPFFKLMRGFDPFTWTEEVEQAFQEMKQYLTSLPVLVAPKPGETLFLYLAAMTEVISMVLVAERSEQLMQGAPKVPPAVSRGPTFTDVTTDPASRGPAGLDPGKSQKTWGPESPQLREKGPVPLPKSRPSKSRSTTSARSYMKQRPDIPRHISSFMLYLLRPGSSAIISRPIKLWW
jgi:hypothetical protein